MVNKREMVCYGSDASRMLGTARKVIFPKTIEEVKNIIKTSGLDIVPRGGGTSLVGGAVPNNSTVVDMTKMNKVCGFDTNKNLVSVEAGISFKELNEKLRAIGFEFPIHPINQASTIGGMVAMNIAGPRSLRYGKIKQWLEEIEFVNGRGELMKTSKADLSDSCGMEGITGIIVKAKVKAIPRIKRSASVFQTDSLDEILKISRRLKNEKDVAMLLFFSRKISGMLGLPEKYNLIVEFDSERGKILGENCERIMRLKEKVQYTLLKERYYNNEQSKFFFDKLKDFILYLDSNEISYFGYLGQGVIHSFFRDDEDEKKESMFKLIRRMGGKFGEGGIGLKRKPLVDAFEKKILQSLKSRLDPFGKLNQGKIIDFEPKISKDVGKANHLKPLQEDEIEQLKPFIETRMEVNLGGEDVGEAGEEGETEIKSGTQISIKSPDEKMEEFIEKVELLDEKPGEEGKDEEKEEIGEELSEEELSAEELIKESGEDDEKKAMLRDYIQTYESELPAEKAKRVEEIAKNIPRDIVIRQEEKEEQELMQKGKLSEEQQKAVDKIMGDNFGFTKIDDEEEFGKSKKLNLKRRATKE